MYYEVYIWPIKINMYHILTLTHLNLKYYVENKIIKNNKIKCYVKLVCIN